MRKSTLLLASGVVVLATSSTSLFVQLKTERTRAAELRRQLDVLHDTKAGPAITARAVASSGTANVQPERSGTSTRTTDDTAARIEAARKRHERYQARERQLMSDPEYRNARLQEQRLQLYARREDALRLLGFTQAEANGVIDLMAEMDLLRQALQSPLNETDRLQRIEQEAALKRNLDQGLRNLLGDSKYAQWQDYMASLPTRVTVNQLQTQLGGIESLRDDQIEPLVAALRPVAAEFDKEMATFRESAGPNVPETIEDDLDREEHRLDVVAMQNRRMHAAAAPILSERQLAMLDAQLQRSLDVQRTWLSISRASMKETGGKTKIP